MAVMGEQAAANVVDHGTPVFMRTQRYGAELSTTQFSLLIAAIALGTLMECEYGSSPSARRAPCMCLLWQQSGSASCQQQG
jgi:hypothetical protein